MAGANEITNMAPFCDFENISLGVRDAMYPAFEIKVRAQKARKKHTAKKNEKIWGSMVKSTMQRRRPGFNESAYGYRSFKELVEDAEKRRLLTMTRDEKSGQYTIHLTPSE